MKINQEEKKKAWLAYVKRPHPKESIPQKLYDGTCGAKTRQSTSCKLHSIYRSGKCRWHGSLSTGAKTVEGKKKVALNGFKKGWRKTNPI